MKRPDRHELPHRIRIGLTGLAGVFVLVLIGAVFAKFIREGEQQQARDAVPGSVQAVANTSAPVAPSDPLADLGVAPGGPESDLAAANRTAP